MKTSVHTEKAPGAIGPYSQAIATESLVFTSGQLPIDVSTGALEDTDIAKATEICLSNVRSILTAAGTSMNNIVKTTIFLTDLADFDAVNLAYAAFFSDAPPARSCVQVAALPKGARIEIEAIALK
jgi:2-iminobutanoate/2-iminopropanoate deaminase